MDEYIEQAIALFHNKERYFNCAQAVFIPFAEKKGWDLENAAAVAGNFGAGMKMGSVCGAITGGLMALGLYGVTEQDTVSSYYRTIRGAHNNMVNCKDLLAESTRNGTPRAAHCDEMVRDAVQAVYDILTEKKLLK